MTGSRQRAARPMSPATARLVTWGIISFCALALFSVFQPFWLPLYGAGCLMVVIGGLVFNLMPFANPQNPAWRLLKVAAIVLAILIFAVLLAIGFVELLL
jgi:predicted PurR-regulated permease PerM